MHTANLLENFTKPINSASISAFVFLILLCMFHRFLTALLLSLLSFLSILTVYATDFSMDVFPWLMENSLTRFTVEKDLSAHSSITRGEAAKFVVNYAHVIGIEKTRDTCNFSDTKTYDISLRPFTVEACEYGLFKGSDGRFAPSNKITEAQALAVIIRSLYGTLDEVRSPWYADYYETAKEYGLITTETLK